MQRCLKDQCFGTIVSPGQGHTVKVLCGRVHLQQH